MAETFQQQVWRVGQWFRDQVEAHPDQCISMSDNDKPGIIGDPDPDNPDNLELAVVATLNASGYAAEHWNGQVYAAMTPEILAANAAQRPPPQ